MSTKWSAVNGLKDRNIELNEEEIYAVIIGYNRKLNALNSVAGGQDEKESALAMLQAAMHQSIEPNAMHKKALDKAIADYQRYCNPAVQTVLSKEQASEEDVVRLHEKTVKEGCTRAYRETQKSGNEFAAVDELLNSETSRYLGELEEVQTLYRIASVYQDAEIQAWLDKVDAPISVEVMKQGAKRSLPQKETDFVSFQAKFVTYAVGYNVDQDCRMIKTAEAEA